MIKNRFNLRNVVVIAICLVSTATMFAQETNVVINGVKWATRNVGTPGTFVDNPEDYGGYYRWNTKKHVAPENYPTLEDGATWLPENDPSPTGYRVPTRSDFYKLYNSLYVIKEWTTQNGVNGTKFTDKTSGNSIFLPAAGSCENYYEMNFYYRVVGSGGYYWCNSSSRYGPGAVSNPVKGNYEFIGIEDYYGSSWTIWFSGQELLSVRPVANDDISTDINEISVDTENSTVIGYFDMFGRKLKEEPTTGIYIIQYDNGKTKKMIK